MKHFYRSLECRVPSAECGLYKKECFHKTSQRPYWCPKTMKRRPCWCPKPILWELNSFLMQTLSFVPINLYRCWPREWKHSTAISRMVVGKNVHVTIPKGNMGYDQYTALHTAAVEPTFFAFLQQSQTYIHGPCCHSFKFLWRAVN